MGPWAILERIIKIRELDVLSIISRSAKATCISKEALESSFKRYNLGYVKTSQLILLGHQIDYRRSIY